MGSQRVRHNLATEQQQQPYTDQHVSVPEYTSCQLSLGHNQTNIQYTCNNSKALPGYDEKSISQKSFQLYLLCCRRRQWQPTSSTLAWKTPWTEKPGRPQSMGSRRLRHDWAAFPSLPFPRWTHGKVLTDAGIEIRFPFSNSVSPPSHS